MQIYIVLHMKYLLFLSCFNTTWIFSTNFRNNTQISNFMKIRPVRAELFHADRRTDTLTERQDEAYGLFEVTRLIQSDITDVLNLYSVFGLVVQLYGSRDSSMGIATRNGLDGPGTESRWGVGVEILRTRSERPWGPLSLL